MSNRFFTLILFTVSLIVWYSIFGMKLVAQPRLILPIGHTGLINNAFFSADNKNVLTASYDNSAKVWSVQSGALLADLNGHTGEVTTASFSSDGKKVVTASYMDGSVKIWDLRTGMSVDLVKPIASFQPRLTAISPDGKKVLTISVDNTVFPRINSAQLWDIDRKIVLADLKSSFGYVLNICFSPDSERFITASGEEPAKIWDARTGTLLVDLKIQTGTVLSDLDPRIQIGLVRSASFSPDGEKIITSSWDSTTRIWDARTGKHLSDLNGRNFWIENACFSSKSEKIVTASDDETAKLWDAQTGKLLIIFKGHTGTVNSACFSPDGNMVVTASGDSTAKIWNPRSGLLLADLRGHNSVVKTARFSPDGKKIVTASWDNSAKIWDVQSGLLLADLKGSSFYIYNPSFSADDKTISVSSGFTTKLWNSQNATLTTNLKLHTNYGSSHFSPDGKKIITLYYDTAKIWDVESGALLTDLKNNSNFYPYTCFSADSRKVLTVSWDSTAKIWDIQTGKLIGKLKEDFYIGSASFSGDGNKIVTTAWKDSTAKIWDAHSLKFLSDLREIAGIQNASFSPDAKKILTTSSFDSTPKLWDANSGVLLAKLKGHQAYVRSAVFSPDGSKVVTTSSDQTAKLWESQSGTLLANMKGHNSHIISGSFSTDSRKVITISVDNTAKIWSANNGALLYSFFAVDSNDYFVQMPSGYYKCTPNAAKLLHYVDKDLKVITFEQLDVKYNRPDLVLEAIGSPDTSLIYSYKKAWEKRIRKLGFDTTLFGGSSLRVPEADIQNRDSILFEQTSNKLSLNIKAKDDSISLDRYNVWINEVPVFGVRGISLKSRKINHFDTTLTLALSAGTNRIETSVTNVGGLESYRTPLDVKYTGPQEVKENLYFIGIGIDRFADSRYNLSWSVKDIRDLALNFRKKYGVACRVDTLFDQDVTVEKIKALKQALLKSTENDKVIIAYSGHGLLSKDYDYFLSTYGVNFQDPQKEGLPYEMLEDLLDGIPARKKLVLIDACHSGEVDKEELSKMVRAQTQLDKNQKGVIVLTDTTGKRLGTKNSFELMQQVFVNVGRGTGATIISAAAGTQFALERGDLKNGVFSYSILELMKTNQTVTVSQMKNYVNKRVTELTNGAQVPTSRTENKVMDWKVW